MVWTVGAGFRQGPNPFSLAYPILSSGKGASEGALGLIVAEELGGFSFFQSIHYQKTQPLVLDSSNPFLGAGTFQWPDNVLAEGRVEYLIFQRAHRFVSFYYDVRMRMSGLMEFNHQPLTYGQNPNGQTTDMLFFSQGGIVVKVDKDFSADGSVAFFPFEFGLPIYRPDAGLMFSLSLVFRPI